MESIKNVLEEKVLSAESAGGHAQLGSASRAPLIMKESQMGFLLYIRITAKTRVRGSILRSPCFALPTELKSRPYPKSLFNVLEEMYYLRNLWAVTLDWATPSRAPPVDSYGITSIKKTPCKQACWGFSSVCDSADNTISSRTVVLFWRL